MKKIRISEYYSDILGVCEHTAIKWARVVTNYPDTSSEYSFVLPIYCAE